MRNSALTAMDLRCIPHSQNVVPVTSVTDDGAAAQANRSKPESDRLTVRAACAPSVTGTAVSFKLQRMLEFMGHAYPSAQIRCVVTTREPVNFLPDVLREKISLYLIGVGHNRVLRILGARATANRVHC